MAATKNAGQIKAVDLTRGLFVVRYASAEDEFAPPSVTVAFDLTDARGAEVILHPDMKEPVLWQPGSALIVRATQAVKLLLEVGSARDGGSTAANVKVERLTQGEPAAPSKPLAAAQASLDLAALRLLGHVAGVGDVVVKVNEWIAGPAAPSRIEGIAVEWPDKPPHLDLRYSVRLGRPQAGPSRMVAVGSYAGTRGQALPLTGVIFELSGVDSSQHQISADAAFLGSPTMRVIGKRVVLSGPTGTEPLVGLRFSIERAKTVAEPLAVVAPPPASPPAPAAKPSGRVRVFRSRPKEGPSS
jgi:hypothetical protein